MCKEASELLKNIDVSTLVKKLCWFYQCQSFTISNTAKTLYFDAELCTYVLDRDNKSHKYGQKMFETDPWLSKMDPYIRERSNRGF